MTDEKRAPERIYATELDWWFREPGPDRIEYIRADHFAALEKSLAGIRNPAAVRELIEAVDAFKRAHAEWSEAGWDCSGEIDHVFRARAALDKEPTR